MGKQSENEDKILVEGTAASPGVVEGAVRILHSPEEVHKINYGDILVAAETTPEYTPAILKAAAIVTDFGGVLSHSAIVAREMGIPGVVGTENATKILKENMKVIVDGSKGIVLKKHS